MIFKTELFFEPNLLVGFVIFLSALFWVLKYRRAKKTGSGLSAPSTNSTLENFLFNSHKISKFITFTRIFSAKKQKSKSKELPTICTYALLWNLIFCPHKVQNFDVYCGSLINQVLMGICISNVKETFVKLSGMGLNYAILFHPESVQEVLKSNIIVNKNWSYDIFIPWLGNSILTSVDDDWRRRRKMITSTLHIRMLESFHDIFYERSNTLIEKLKKEMKNEVFDITEIIKLCTLDIIADASLGVPINAQEGAGRSYLRAIEGITAFSVHWNVEPWYWFPPILNHSRLGKKFKSDIKTVHQFDKRIIQKKKEKLLKDQEIESISDSFREDEVNTKKRPLLDLLLYYHIHEGTISEEDVRGEMENFIFAGHDTAAVTISWALYYLGMHQDMQEKAIEELQEIFSDDFYRKITTNDLKRMNYLERVIKETLRINPPLPFIFRRNPSEMKIGEYILPPKSSYMICIYAVHHNPAVYENPEIFDPDRFLPENIEKRHPFAFIPFSGGPRSCLGQRFAMMEMKTLLANIVRNFKLKSVDPRDKICISADVVLRPKYGLRMNFQKREIVKNV